MELPSRDITYLVSMDNGKTYRLMRYINSHDQYHSFDLGEANFVGEDISLLPIVDRVMVEKSDWVNETGIEIYRAFYTNIKYRVSVDENEKDGIKSLFDYGTLVLS